MQASPLNSFIEAVTQFFGSPIPLFWPVAITCVTSVLVFWLYRRYSRVSGLLETAQLLTDQLKAEVGDLAERQERDRLDFDSTRHKLTSAQTSVDLLNRTALEAQKENAELREKLSTAESERKRTEAFLQSERQRLEDQSTAFKELVATSEKNFRSLSESILNERVESLSKHSKEGVESLLRPLKIQLGEFQSRVNTVHSEATQGNQQLRSELEFVKKMGLELQHEASSLTNALRGDSQKRGAWGEAQLLRTLQLCGLVETDHFERQTTFVEDDGKRKITDFIVKLPDDKCIIIDSKVSLNAYEAAANAAPEDFERLIKVHIQVIRNHIKDLSSKQYTNATTMHSPDFVLMFMPIEPAYIDAVSHDPSLHEFGLERNVVLVTHGTLLPVLRVVSNLWMMDRSNKETRALGELANDIYNSVALVSERFAKVGNSLKTVTNHYNDTVTSLTGTQGLQKKVERFGTMSAKANKTMIEPPEHQIEVDSNKLALKALPLDEEEPGE